MKFAAVQINQSSGHAQRRGRCQAFTLAEVLAAMLFMAIVIPVAVQGLRIASLAGSVAQRKAEAGRIAERILNESLILSNWSFAAQVGTTREGFRQYRYNVSSEPWDQFITNQPAMSSGASGQLLVSQPQVDQLAANQIVLNLLSVEVLYEVQGREYSVKLNTLVEPQ